MIRPHTRPSRTRRTAEVDHRHSGTHFVWKNKGFCASAISLKNTFRARLPSKLHRQLIQQHHLQSHLHCGNDPTVANHNAIPSATHPPAPLASHLQCGNDPTVANHNGILSTTHARKIVDTPFTMRNRSENDPTIIRG